MSDADQILRLRDAYVMLRDLVASGEFALDKTTSDALHAVIARNEALEHGHFRGEGALLSNVSVNLGERGTHEPPPTMDGAANLRAIYTRGLEALTDIDGPFERGCAYFLFAADNQFYFDGNKRTARSMMNGVLMASGIDAVLVPKQAREEFNSVMVDFHATRDGTPVMELFGSCGPRREATRARQAAINRQVRAGAPHDAGGTAHTLS